MAAAKLSTETVFLREFARTYISAISFTPEAMLDLESLVGIGLGDVMHVLRNGRVIISEKEDADGAKWLASGRTCEDREMYLMLKVWTDRYFIRVLKVRIRESE